MRRAHQNDIENILPFLILGFLYMFTNHSYATALLCYRYQQDWSGPKKEIDIVID